MTKKILAIILAALMVASLAACTGGEGNETTDEGKINITENTTNGSTEQTTEPDGETGGNVDTSVEKTPGELDYTESVAKVYILHKNGAVNLRKADGTVFKSFPNGTELQMIAISADGSVTKVVFEEETYYVYSSCVTTLADPDEGFEDADLTVVVATASLKIRIVPDFENTHEAIGFYQEGDEVKVIAINTTNPDEPWYKVEFVSADGETKTGYVSAAKKWYVQEETTEGTNTEAATDGETGTEA